MYLSAGSSSESGRGMTVDGEKRELEEEEAVGDLCCPCLGDAKGNLHCVLELQTVA